MNWDAIGALAEVAGTLAVVITLAYLAIQVKHAKLATADANRLTRASGVREMTLLLAHNDEVRSSVLKTLGLESYYSEFGEKFSVESQEAQRFDFVAQYYFWLHWGQFSTTSTDKDREELRHIIGVFYSLPAIKHAWNNSPFGKVFFESDFVEFVDSIIGTEDA